MPPIWQLKLPPAPSGARPGLGDMGTPGIDLFTYMVTILNLLDLRSIMGCLGVLAQYLHTLSGRELHCLFLRKKTIIITSKHGTMIFFPITIFL